MAHPRLDRRTVLAGLGVAALAGCAPARTRGDRYGDDRGGTSDRRTGARHLRRRPEPVGRRPPPDPGHRPAAWSWSSTAASGRPSTARRFGTPLAEDLRGRGGRWSTWSTAGSATGAASRRPSTMSQQPSACSPSTDVGTSAVVTLGHSAGGHLATWAAARTRFDEWSGGIAVTHVISQAGVLDLTPRRSRAGRRRGRRVDGGRPQRPVVRAGRPDAADPARRAGVGGARPRRRRRAVQPVRGLRRRRRPPPAPRPRSSRSPAATSG